VLAKRALARVTRADENVRRRSRFRNKPITGSATRRQTPSRTSGDLLDKDGGSTQSRSFAELENPACVEAAGTAVLMSIG
jgi:hypothetical protein